jgi:AGZA family xanthine/uracil permease-like MFS transporter
MLMIDSALGAAGTSAATVGLDKLGQVGVLYHGLDVLGSGATIVGMVLGAMAAFIIDKKFIEASAFALAGAVLTFFGFMHGEAVGIAVSPTVALAYLLAAALLFALRRAPVVAPATNVIHVVPVAVPAE